MMQTQFKPTTGERMLPIPRILVTLAAVVLGIVLFVSTAQAAEPEIRCDWSGQTYADFYTPPNTGLEALDRPGQIIRLEHIRTFTPIQVAAAARVQISAYGAEAYRILYFSQGPAGIPQTVSAVVVVPLGNAPAGGFPLLVHGHGTVGMADQCAPSKSDLTVTDLLRWTVSGYMVVATDYAGLGTPGLHPYGIGDIAAYGLLDSARAALSFCDTSHRIQTPANNRVILEGHSQGGQAALFATQLADAYAPELNVEATVLFAPGAEFRYLAKTMADTRWSARLSPFSMGIYSFSKYYNAPATLEEWLRPKYASGLPDRAENQCSVRLSAWLGLRPDDVLKSTFLENLSNNRWDLLQPWTDYIDVNEPGNFSDDTPILILQGDFDTVVPPEVQKRLAARLCSNNVPVALQRYPLAGHLNIVTRGTEFASEWIDGRLAQEPLRDVCVTGDDGRGPLARRGLEPVVVDGSSLPQLGGSSVDQLFAYAYHTDSGWSQIPFQIDEVTATGNYTGTEDALLDENDEFVFMAMDAGESYSSGASPADVLPIGADWYGIRVTDPISTGVEGWVYIVQSTQLTKSFSIDYVDFNVLTQNISGQSYSARLPAFRIGLEDLRLGNGDNILDRTKYRLLCDQPIVCPITEQSRPLIPQKRIVKDGPVRAILNDGYMLAYGAIVEWSQDFSIPESLNPTLLISTDFSEDAKGSTLYNAVVPAGVIVDGDPDEVAGQPMSAWWQLTTDTGSIVQLTDVDSIGGTPTTYYLDQEQWDAADTGDKRHYGDTGLRVVNPNLEFSYNTSYFLLPDTQPNLGEQYMNYFEQPLQAQTFLNGVNATEPSIFIPWVRGDSARPR